MNLLIDKWAEARLNRSKLQALRKKYRTVYHLLGAYVDCRNAANEGRFSPKVMFAKAMSIHKLVSDWAEARGRSRTEVVEVPFDESLSGDLEELFPIELFPVPGRPGRPKNPRPK